MPACFAYQCRAAVMGGQLMCKSHWYVVPRDLRHIITRLWKEARREQRRAMDDPEYKWAILRAKRFVADAESADPVALFALDAAVEHAKTQAENSDAEAS